MTEKMKTIKIEADVHRRLKNYRFQLQAQLNRYCTLGEAINEALNAVASLKEEP